INRAEDREQFSALCRKLGIRQPPHGIARSAVEAEDIVDQIGLPVLVRPSFVLGGRAMRVVFSYEELTDYLDEMYGGVSGDAAASTGAGFDLSDRPLLIDRFLEAATEIDVDAVYDGVELLVGGIMEHVEEAGVHSGDSACVTPPPTLSAEATAVILKATEDLARELEVKGLINLQFAVKANDVFLLEANPRGSRTVPFISKAANIPLAKIAARVMLGATIAGLREEGLVPAAGRPDFVSVKEAVLPWNRFPEEDIVLGPEMRATGEVMGISDSAGVAFGKALLAAGMKLPETGNVFFSMADRDKAIGLAAAQALTMLGFKLVCTSGTGRYLDHYGVPNEVVAKVGEATDDAFELIESGQVHLVVNTPRGRRARSDGRRIRLAAQHAGIPCLTTVQGALAAARSLQAGRDAIYRVRSLQDWHA
ncbi:MAG: ATP-grasp domain-containing protein, partial [Acidimicrobiia bacterium]|nr:ATP-grasp domain-containing protein [Acidimicrobiia bacterium]